MRYSVLAKACFFVFAASSGGAGVAFADAFCNPVENSGASCVDLACPELGRTQMDGDKQNIVACLSVEASQSPECSEVGTCKWQSVTANPRTARMVSKSFGNLKSRYPGCTDPWMTYMACSSACDVACMEESYDGGTTKFVGGVISEWGNGFGGCSCFL